MYTRIFDTYQKNDAESLMWFEPTVFGDIIGAAGGIVAPVGFEVPPGGEIGSNKHVLNDHSYCCQLSAHACPNGEPLIEWAAKCRQWHEKRIVTRALDAERLGLPFMITEFGACLTEGPCSQEIR
jgi:hypothetical protein